MKTKKIIIIGPAYPYRGGQALVEAYLHNTITQLGYDTLTISYTLLYPSIFFPGTTQYDHSKLIPFEHNNKIKRLLNSVNPFSWLKTYKEIKKENPDAVIFVWWMPFFGPALGYIARKIHKNLPKTKNIFLVENYISHENRWFDKFFTKQTLKYADAFISESSYITKQITKDFSQKPTYQTTLSVYDCFDLKRYTKATSREKLNINTENVILFFGMIRPYKGLDKLIEAFSTLKDSDATLLIVGESYENIDKYKLLIEQSGLQEKTMFINKFIDNDEIELYFKAADVVVLPYYSGTQSGILMMAYGFGIPVVATNVGGVAELIKNKTGIVVANNEIVNLYPAIKSILDTKNTVCYSEEIYKLTHSLGYDNLKSTFEELL
jgi:glycosyltransferase involved in cell wall biosynthesis